MSNSHLRDRSITLKAKGLLSLILSLPDGWGYSLKGLATLSSDGLDSTRAALSNLEEHGYIMRVSYRASNHSFNLRARNGVRIEGNTVTQNGEPLFAIHRRHSAKKTQGCYRELTPTLEYIRQEKKQEKSSIRDQLKAAAKSQPEKKAPAKAKSHDMEL